MKRPAFILWCSLFAAMILGIGYIQFRVWRNLHPEAPTWYFLFSGR